MKVIQQPKGPLVKVQYEIEKDVVECIQAMEKHTKINASLLVGQALRRYITHHKDYLPDDYEKK